MNRPASKTTRTIKVDYLARVEGEGALYIKLRGDRVEDVKLKIFEPPRLFEAFLRGRHFMEAPDITARICGICPIAYQMSAAHAIERALGVTVPPAIRLLRRLFYCGEWIESHALHLFLLHAPDFLGYQDALEMAREHRSIVEQGLRLKKIGNHLVAVMGGREIHPISACVGGFYRVPAREELLALKPDLEWALEASLATLRWTATLDYPDFEQDYEFVSLRHSDEYPLNEGRLVSNRGLDIDVAEFEDHFMEQHVKHSTALQAVLRERGSYMVGPLARVNLNFDKLPEAAREAAAECGFQVPCWNPFRSIQARALELIFACDEALRIMAQYEPPASPRVEVTPRDARGWAITEAPRGILYHRYSIAADGRILSARIVPPTSQNQRRMEDDLRALVPLLVDQPDEKLTWKCEQAVRN
ncbi:MAG: Ni/Fe hydrogenase subunit alpha, partial [Bryobacteraceae bacterium]